MIEAEKLVVREGVLLVKFVLSLSFFLSCLPHTNKDILVFSLPRSDFANSANTVRDVE